MHAALDMWIWGTAADPNIQDNGKHDIGMTNFGMQFLRTSRDCAHELGHNGFVRGKRENLGDFVILTGKRSQVAGCFCGCNNT